MLYRKGLVSYGLTDDITYAVRLLKEYIPNISIEAVYFDGKYMHSARDQVRYDYDNSQLNIEVTPDGSEYAPGDTVTLNIRLTDKEGKGRSGEVAISVVDEAFFALFDQSVHMLSDIYGQSFQQAIYVKAYPTPIPWRIITGLRVAKVQKAAMRAFVPTSWTQLSLTVLPSTAAAVAHSPSSCPTT
jgi:hypothetical protein